MKVLVTGGTGFIGGHLVEKLVDNGEKVRCLVRKTGKTDFLKKLDVELVFGDINNKASLKDAVVDVDIVYHLAAIVDHRHANSYRDHYGVSVVGTENLVESCLAENIKNFVYFSSIAAIGPRNVNMPVDETVSCQPITNYGKGKLEAERMLLNYFNEFNFPVTILRPPIVYGRGDRQGGILSLTKIINNIIRKNLPFPFISHGKNLTSLCYVENLVDGTVLIGNSKYKGEVYHIADTRPYVIKEIVETIADVLNGKLRTFSVPKSLIWLGSLAFEPFKMIGLTPPLYRRKFLEMTANFALDITKIRKLGYNPEDKFRKYVKETVEWYRGNKLL